MTGSEQFNTDMLRLARDARGATQVDLAQWSGVTQALISKIENGLLQPSEDVVEKISAALRFPRSFFFQKERAVGFPPFHYRKRAKLGAKQIARIGANINIRRQHVAKLLRSYEIDIQKPIPQLDLDETGLPPEKIAEKLRGYWMLPRGPVHSITNVIETAGGVIILSGFGTNLMDALSFRSEGLPPLFFMNRDVPGDRLRFSLAHELGHMVMHTIPGEDGEMETQADRFAAEFLMPASEIRPYLTNVKLSTLARVKAYWKVSIKSLIKRAHDLKLITDHYYKVLNIQYNKSFPQGEPGEIPLEKPSLLHRAFRYHIEELGYSIGDIAQLLCLEEEETRSAFAEKPRLRLVQT